METIGALARLTLKTPIGALRLAATDQGLCQILFPRRRAADTSPEAPAAPPDRAASAAARRHLEEAVSQLSEYFRGHRKEFPLSLDLHGTPHQLQVWRALLEIPYGSTSTYGALARKLGSIHGARAVGRGCATNPIPVIVPCHRVLSGAGSLQGFGGGLWRKRALLDLEQGQVLRLPFPGSSASATSTRSR